MKNKHLTIICLMALVVLAGCTREQLEPLSTGHSIRPVLTSCTETKSMSEPDSDNGMPIAVIPVSENPGDSLYMIVYEKDMPEMFDEGTATKGTEVTTSNLATFRMKAYAQENWHDNETNTDYQAGAYFGVPAAATATKGTSEWTISPEQKWLNGVPTSFWSWNEVEPVIDEQEGYDKASFTYTVASAVTSQKDLVLAYNGENVTFSNAGAITNHTSTNADYTRTDDQMDIHFYHALSAIMFDISGVEDVTVDKITLSGIYPGGDCEVTVSDQGVPEFGWTVKGTPTSYSQTFDASDFGSDGKQVAGGGKEFMLIPQALTDASTISVTFSGEDSPAKSIKGTGVIWKPGKYYTYKLSKSAVDWDYTLAFVDEPDLTEAIRVIDDNILLYEPSTRIVKVTSTRKRKTGTQTPENVSWNILSYKLEGGSPVTVNGDSFTDASTGLTAQVDVKNGKITVSAVHRETGGKGHDYYWTNEDNRDFDLDWSPADWSDMSSTNAIDLSKLDYSKDSYTEFTGMTTANCYVIRHAGTYKLPLVYGNAMNGGVTNEESYYPNPGSPYGLDRFVNHLGNGITDPFIENNAGCAAAGAAFMWQSDGDVVKNIHLVGSPQAEGSYDKDNVRYIEFTVDPEKVCQNIALIALLDADDTVMWSWTIWTTNNPDLLQNSIEVSNYVGNQYHFFPLPSVGYIDGEVYMERKDIDITLQQIGGDASTITLTVQQPEIEAYHSNTALYQYGRKDPTYSYDQNSHHYHSYNTALLSSEFTGINTSKTSKVTLADYIKEPCTFFGSDNNQTSLNPYYRNLWSGKNCTYGFQEQNDDLIKTIYDPSPVGYKIPAAKAFSGFIADPSCYVTNPQKINGYFVGKKLADLCLYRTMGNGQTVNTGGDTIMFPYTRMRGQQNGSFNSTTATSGYYHSSNVLASYKSCIFQFSSTAAGMTSSGTGNIGAAVRPVIDTTMPDNPMD